MDRLIIASVLLLLFAPLFLSAYRLFHRWSANNRLPIQTRRVKVIDKRATVWCLTYPVEYIGSFYYFGSCYQATFEFGESHQRMVFQMSASTYWRFEEGEIGDLSFQGTRFLKFEGSAPADYNPVHASSAPLKRVGAERPAKALELARSVDRSYSFLDTERSARMGDSKCLK